MAVSRGFSVRTFSSVSGANMFDSAARITSVGIFISASIGQRNSGTGADFPDSSARLKLSRKCRSRLST